MLITGTQVIDDEPIAATEQLPVSFYRSFGKRAFDLTLALLLVPLLLPLILLLTAIVSTDGGSGIFGHKRIGRDGRVFRCWKVRTMVVNAEKVLREHLASNPAAAAEWARDHKLTDDPRITRLGKFLRRTSLDELPQLANVILGQMSFVGPRPVVRAELHKYGESRDIYKSLKPGITGLWQVSGRNDISYFDRVQLDLAYSSTVSFFSDLRLIALTFGSVVGATGR